MTRKQRERLGRNRESQRLAFAEHANIARQHGVDRIEANYRKPGAIVRDKTAQSGFELSRLRCKESRGYKTTTPPKGW